MTVHYLHVPKTGGSAMHHALERANEVMGRQVVVVHGHEVRLADVAPGDTCIIGVRDPVSRFVSGFNSRLRKGRPLNDIPWTWRERIVFTRFATPDALATALAAHTPASHFAMRTIGHLRPLAHWLGTPDELRASLDRVLHITCQETLDADWRHLRTVLGLPGDLELPADPILSHRTPPGMSTCLGDVGRAAVEQWYRTDAELLAICDDWRRRRSGTSSGGGGRESNPPDEDRSSQPL